MCPRAEKAGRTVKLDHCVLGFGKSKAKCFTFLTSSAIAYLCLGLCLTPTSGAQEPPDVLSPETQPFQQPPTIALQTFTIPDGTQIQLRLAQPVRGMTRTIKGTRVYSKPGDKIRLVAADDVRVNGLVVISRGAVGQATVIKADPPPINTYSYNDRYAALADIFVSKTGSVLLQLDWIEDVTGHAIPLRAYSAGEPKPFTMVVLAENGGIVARPPKLSQDLKLKNLSHVKQWAPAGTRIFGFVHGAINIDPEGLAELKDAQALLPIPNPTAMLTIFRGKGHHDLQPRISCDDKEIAPVGERQYTSLEIAPGKHACHADDRPALEFTVEAGEECFLSLQYRAISSLWELKAVTTAEGEDSVSSLEPAGKLLEKQPTTSAVKGH